MRSISGFDTPIVTHSGGGNRQSMEWLPRNEGASFSGLIETWIEAGAIEEDDSLLSGRVLLTIRRLELGNVNMM